MPRLIDADALNKELQQRVGSPTDDKLYEVNLCIINAPTIDAIPVEWLKWRTMNAKYNGIKEAADAFDFVLNCWKEQEAR